MSVEEAGMGEGGVGEGFSGSVDATYLQWFFFSLFFPSRLSYFSLSLTTTKEKKKTKKKKTKNKTKKKNACTRTPKLLCIFLRNAPRPPPPVSTHKWWFFQSLTTSLSSRWGGGWCLAPQMGTDAWTKGERNAPKQCVQPWTLSDFFPLGPEKLALFYESCIFHTLNDDSAAHCPALKKYPLTSLFCSSIGTKLGSNALGPQFEAFYLRTSKQASCTG